jgi:hypothetical protein
MKMNCPECRDCPYVRDEYAARESYLENIDEYDIPIISRSCYCDKVGGKIGWFGTCGEEEIWKEPTYHIDLEVSSRYKNKLRRAQKEKYKKKLRWQYKNIARYPSPSYPVNKDGRFAFNDDEIAYYKETNKSKSTGIFKYYKRSCNKSVRRYYKNSINKSLLNDSYEVGVGKGKGLYKHIAEYRWMVI